MAKFVYRAPKNTPKCMSTILYYKGKSGIRMSQKCCHHVRSECIKSYAIKRFVIVWNLILWCVSISVVLCADVSVLHSLCSCVQCVHCECVLLVWCLTALNSCHHCEQWWRCLHVCTVWWWYYAGVSGSPILSNIIPLIVVIVIVRESGRNSIWPDSCIWI